MQIAGSHFTRKLHTQRGFWDLRNSEKQHFLRAISGMLAEHQLSFFSVIFKSVQLSFYIPFTDFDVFPFKEAQTLVAQICSKDEKIIYTRVNLVPTETLTIEKSECLLYIIYEAKKRTWKAIFITRFVTWYALDVNMFTFLGGNFSVNKQLKCTRPILL